VTRESVGTLRSDVADLRLRVADQRASARELPHREKYLMIVMGFLDRLLDLHDDYIDEVERELR